VLKQIIHVHGACLYPLAIGAKPAGELGHGACGNAHVIGELRDQRQRVKSAKQPLALITHTRVCTEPASDANGSLCQRAHIVEIPLSSERITAR
jgi:hypothetical protein